MIKVLWLALLAAMIAVGSVSPAAAGAGPSIVVEGNRLMDSDRIRAYFHPEHGALSDADVDSGLKALYATGLFEDVRIKRGNGSLLVTVKENPLIARVAFEGNKAIKDKQLTAAVRSHANGPLSRPLVHDDVEKILELYRRSGHLEARVVPKTIAEKSGRMALVFEVTEGPRTGVGQIVFVGNKAFSDRALKDVIKTGQTNLLSFLLDNDVYDPDKVEGDRDLLARFYRNHGYADAAVTSAVAQYDTKKKRLVLTFTVEEGPQYRLGDVTLDADRKTVDTAALKRLVSTHPGNVYDAAAIDTSVKTVAQNLARHGDPFETVHPDIVRHAASGRIDIVYRIQRDTPLYVERIDIHGNEKTRDYVIRRELDVSEGAPYNQSLVDASEAHLKRTGYFKSVAISKQPGSAPDRVVLNVTVQEQKTADFTVSGGYGDTSGWVAQIGVGDTNFLGRGETAKVSLSYGQYTKGGALSFVEPDIFGWPVSLGFDLFGNETGSSSYQSFSSAIYGASITVGTPLSDTLALAWRYSLKNQSIALDPSQGTASLPVQEAAAQGSQWVSAVGSGVTYSTLDDKRHPREGLQMTVNNDVAGLGGDVNFLRNTEDIRYYTPLSGDIVGMAHGQAGYIVPWGGKSLPLIDGFFGGPQFVRGFATNGFGPRDLTPGTTMDNVGGNAFWAGSYEVQAPVPLLPQSFGLKAAAFVDAGSVWGTGAAGSSPALSSAMVANTNVIRSSVGAGLVWDSVLGPIRMDYAYPLTKAPYDITQRLHFGYGLF